VPKIIVNVTTLSLKLIMAHIELSALLEARNPMYCYRYAYKTSQYRFIDTCPSPVARTDALNTHDLHSPRRRGYHGTCSWTGHVMYLHRSISSRCKPDAGACNAELMSMLSNPRLTRIFQILCWFINITLILLLINDSCLSTNAIRIYMTSE
jgi:hypothetical protein